jgi:hypothetical protein
MAATFIVCGLLIGIAIGAIYVGRKTPRNIDPVPIDATWSSIGDFYRGRPDRDSEVELGRGWTSALDPGASFELSWISATSELVALRQQALPGFTSGGGIVNAVPSGLDPRATGMKVLGVADLDTIRAATPEQLRETSGGLDELTAKLGFAYAPPDPSDAHWAAQRGEGSGEGGGEAGSAGSDA